MPREDPQSSELERMTNNPTPPFRKNATTRRVDAVSKQDVGTRYAEPLHPGTFASPKQGCLKFRTQEESLEEHHHLRHNNMESSLIRSLCLCPCDHKRTVTISDFSGLQSDNASRRSPSPPSAPSEDLSPRMRKSVSFHVIEIRQYERQPGDNPCVSRGAPLSIGWNHVDSDVVSLDEYEGQFGVSRTRRGRQQLALSHVERERLLHNTWGYSMDEIKAASVESSETKRKRSLAAVRAVNPQMSMVDEMMETSGRRINRLLSVTKSKKQDFKRLLKQTQERNAVLAAQFPSKRAVRRASAPAILPIREDEETTSNQGGEESDSKDDWGLFYDI